jgi:hypothetical protein
MKLTQDIDTVYQFCKGAGIVFGYVIGYGLAILIVLGIAICSILAQCQPEKPKMRQITPGLQVYDAQGNIHTEGTP